MALGCVGCGKRLVTDDELGGTGCRCMTLLAAHAVVAQRELQAVVGSFQPGILQSAFEAGGVAPQQVERIGAVGDQARCDVAVVIDVEANLDAAELGRIETDFESVFTLDRLGGDFDGHAGERYRRRL